jgi:hypothetical protein
MMVNGLEFRLSRSLKKVYQHKKVLDLEAQIVGRALLATLCLRASKARPLPKRSAPTFLELLFGAILTQTGFVTDAVLAFDTVRHPKSGKFGPRKWPFEAEQHPKRDKVA